MPVRGCANRQVTSHDYAVSNRGHLPTDFPYALRLGYNVPMRGCANRGDEVTTYDYDELGNLLEVVLPDEVDPRGRRVLEQVNGVTRRGFLYQDRLNPVAELDASGAITSVFLYATRPHVPDLIVRDGATYRVVVDRLGSVRRVVNVTTGAVAQAIDYDSYGRVLRNSAPGFQPFAYAGGIYDPDTSLVRFGARDYDAELGRWTAKDPILFGGGDTNIYAYALGDPINGHDPLGLAWYDYFDTAHDGGLQTAANFFAGMGDTTSMGLTGFIRTAAGIDEVDRCSSAYAGGEYASMFVDFFASGGGKLLAAGGRGLARAIRGRAGRAGCFTSETTVVTSHGDVQIHEIEVGDRVLTARSEVEFETRVRPTWEVIDLEVQGRDGQVITLTVLRPRSWLLERDTDDDGAFEISMPELGVDGIAYIVQVREPPLLEVGPGRVVLSTISRPSDHIMNLRFESETDELHVTREHRFYSVDRDAWIAARELEIGEGVHGRHGPTPLLSRAPSSSGDVFNIEVERDHEYLVGVSALRVHNVCDAAFARIVERHGGTVSRVDPTHAMFPNRQRARRAASEVAGDLGASPETVRKHMFRGGPRTWYSNRHGQPSMGIIGRRSTSGPSRGWRDDLLGHPRFGAGPHVNAWRNGREFHLWY